MFDILLPVDDGIYKDLTGFFTIALTLKIKFLMNLINGLYGDNDERTIRS